MRFFSQNPQPEIHRVLLVESGPPELVARFLPVLRKVCGKAVELDVFSCVDPPEPGYESGIRTFYRSQDFHGRAARGVLLRQLRSNSYQAVVIICASSPLLLRWKWVLALLLPARVLIANENADCFWLDAAHWRQARSMLTERLGLRGSGGFRTLGRLFLFPWVLLYLILFALFVHGRSRLRFLFGRRPSARLS